MINELNLSFQGRSLKFCSDWKYRSSSLMPDPEGQSRIVQVSQEPARFAPKLFDRLPCQRNQQAQKEAAKKAAS